MSQAKKVVPKRCCIPVTRHNVMGTLKFLRKHTDLQWWGGKLPDVSPPGLLLGRDVSFLVIGNNGGWLQWNECHWKPEEFPLFHISELGGYPRKELCV